MMNFVSSDSLFALVFALLRSSVGWIVKEQFFTKPCPDCICPECPPQTVLHINNEKIKAKNGGAIDLTSIIKDNKITQSSDSIGEKKAITPKRKGFLKRIFNKN